MDTLKPFIIAETANNHEGDKSYLLKVIDDIDEIKLDAIKFHLMLNIESYFQKTHPLIKDASKWLFSKSEWQEVLSYAQQKELEIITLCNDAESIDFILHYYPDIFAIEIHATSLNDYFLLEKVLNFKGKIILGIGGSTIDEVDYAINFLRNRNKNDIILVYGFQSYPTNYSDINLSKMIKIRNMFNLPVGYADHTAFNDKYNLYISCLAAASGFNILEKHYTLDFGKERIDYHSSVGKKQMLDIKYLMEITLKTHGDGSFKLSSSEQKYGNTGPMKKAIVARKLIKAGKIIKKEDLWFKRTVEETPLLQKDFYKLVGLKASRDILEDEIVDFSKVEYKFLKTKQNDFTHLK